MDGSIPMNPLQARIEQLEELVGQLTQENLQLKQRIAALEEQLQAEHRQAAPFRRRESRKKPPSEHKRSGRPAGHPGAYRRVPDHIDQEIVQPLSECPCCGGAVTDVTECVQFIEELPPVKPITIRLTTYVGQCPDCGEVRSTHPLQTSTATGAAGTHLGPRAKALAAFLSHRSGLSMRRACELLWEVCGLRLTPGGLAQLLGRTGQRLEGWYEAIGEQIRQSRAVFADETSWYVGETGWWLWVFTTPKETLYRVEHSRGSDIILDTLGTDYQGMLVSDCLSSYGPIDCRKHKCIAHHLRVLKEHEAVLEKRGEFSQDLLLWKLHLKDVIATWQARETMSAEDYALKVLQLKRGVETLLERSPPEPEAVAFRDRLRRVRDDLLGCLAEPAAEPTNNRAERDLRPAVIDRKLSCGNKTPAGKRAWEIVRSVLETVQKQGRNLLDALLPHLRLSPEEPPR